MGKPEAARRTGSGKDGDSGVCTVCIVGWMTGSDMEEVQWIGDIDVISGVDGAQDKTERMGVVRDKRHLYKRRGATSSVIQLNPYSFHTVL